MSTSFGAQTAWRQLVDLIGRGRAPASEMALTRLRSIRPQVPSSIRAASARALAFARPPAGLVRLFAEEDLPIAAPVLRMAELSNTEWIEMLPVMSPSGRSVLRHRRDLPEEVQRALASYGPSDFILPPGPVAEPEPQVAEATPVEAIDDVADPPELSGDHALVAVPSAIEPVTAAETPVSEPAVPMPEIAIDPVDPVSEALPAAPLHPVEVPSAEAEAAIEPVVDTGPMPLIDSSSAGLIPATEIDVPAPVVPIVAEAIDWTEVIRARPPVDSTGPGAVQPASAPIAPAPVVEADAESALVAEMPMSAAPVEATVPIPLAEASIEPVADVSTMATPVEADAPPESNDSVAPTLAASDSSFVSVASVAFGLPVVVEALRQHQADPPAMASAEASLQPIRETDAAPAPAAPAPEARGPFQISDLVARIDAFNRQREEDGRGEPTPIIANDVSAPAAPEAFRFETDPAGLIRWVDGVSRSAIIGMTLNQAAGPSQSGVDGIAAGAFRRRAAFANARMLVPGESSAAGQWRISALPGFDPATGRFTGYRGTARRPRKDECAEPGHVARTKATDSLRELVHELRTPTTAIAGFAEMIEGQLLGPVPNPYRDYAATISAQARDLLGAIDDLDMAARIEAHALELRPTDVAIAPLLGRVARDLEPLAQLRGARLQVEGTTDAVLVRGDDRAVDRLIARLMAALLSATAAGETLRITVGSEGAETVAISAIRPSGLAAYVDDAVLAIDAETEAEAEGAPLLGTGFALRLARNLAGELGGSLSIGADRLTLRLPAAFTDAVDQASTI